MGNEIKALTDEAILWLQQASPMQIMLVAICLQIGILLRHQVRLDRQALYPMARQLAKRGGWAGVILLPIIAVETIILPLYATVGLMGGTIDKQKEKARLRRVNKRLPTPDELIQHIDQTRERLYQLEQVETVEEVRTWREIGEMLSKAPAGHMPENNQSRITRLEDRVSELERAEAARISVGNDYEDAFRRIESLEQVACGAHEPIYYRIEKLESRVNEHAAALRHDDKRLQDIEGQRDTGADTQPISYDLSGEHKLKASQTVWSESK